VTPGGRPWWGVAGWPRLPPPHVPPRRWAIVVRVAASGPLLRRGARPGLRIPLGLPQRFGAGYPCFDRHRGYAHARGQAFVQKAHRLRGSSGSRCKWTSARAHAHACTAAATRSAAHEDTNSVATRGGRRGDTEPPVHTSTLTGAGEHGGIVAGLFLLCTRPDNAGTLIIVVQINNILW
jgi:hypothetical protein